MKIIVREEPIRSTVKQYPCQTATVGNIFLVLPREDLAGLERKLSIASRSIMDNHTVYEINHPLHGTTYLNFTDFNVYFGHTVEVVAH